MIDGLNKIHPTKQFFDNYLINFGKEKLKKDKKKSKKPTFKKQSA